ncbi:collagen binding domain-containing protein [Streptomyces noursei]|uniref:MSCRAMM family protein n=1 Tax=Streptomyces noursei TaxID=1971 RepID=UPI0035E2BB5F
MAVPAAQASDQRGPGYSIPDSSGHQGASHIGAFGKPAPRYHDAPFLGYCTDPEDVGPSAGVHYGPITNFTTWKSKLTGKQVPAANIAKAALILSDVRQPTDAEAAAVDAAIATYLNPGTSYAVPNGSRALQRLSYPNVSPQSKKLAAKYMKIADRYAGPYKVNIHMPASLKPGAKTRVTLDVTSAAGNKLSGVKLDVSGATGTAKITTDASGTATTTITAPKAGTATVKAVAKVLPSYTLRAQIPDKPTAQRLAVTGGHSSASATASARVGGTLGGLTITKTAAVTHKLLGGVVFEVKDSHNKTVAKGSTDASGVLRIGNLKPGQYVVHEVQAAEGYQLAADKRVSVGDLAATTVSVVDAKMPKKSGPGPHSVHLPKVLPQTGI